MRASIEAMKKRGIKTVEGYPMITAKGWTEAQLGMSWRGPLKILEEFGFKTVQAIKPFRPLVRSELGLKKPN